MRDEGRGGAGSKAARVSVQLNKGGELIEHLHANRSCG